MDQSLLRFSFLVVKDCHECKNKHLFCHSCIVAWSMTSGQNSQCCPYCRCEQTVYASNKAVDRLIEVCTACPTTLHYTTLHYTTLHYTTLHYTTLHYTTLHYTTLHYTTPHHTTPHHTTPHHTTPHHTTPHHTTPHSHIFSLQALPEPHIT